MNITAPRARSAAGPQAGLAGGRFGGRYVPADVDCDPYNPVIVPGSPAAKSSRHRLADVARSRCGLSFSLRYVRNGCFAGVRVGSTWSQGFPIPADNFPNELARV